jgi:RecA/RadA recombinase
MADKDSKLKALKLTLDKLDKTYGKGSVMKLGDQTMEKVETIFLFQLKFYSPIGAPVKFEQI